MVLRLNYPDSDEAQNRMQWFLNEYGRFPTADELIAIRQPEEHTHA